jgi:hypothetical protein
MAYKFVTARICDLLVIVSQDFYDGLWYLKYEDGTRYAGPWKTKREAVEKLQREAA